MIFVTGGTGLIGSQLLFDIVKSGKRVRALKRPGSSLHIPRRLFSSQEEFDRIEWVDGDVNDLFSLEESIKGVEAIYHSAAYISFNGKDRMKMFRVNVEGTANMVNLALKFGVKRFCHVSSTSALGRTSGETLVDEECWWKQSKENSNYGITKYSAEREVWRAMEEGLSAFIINPSIVIGPGNWRNGSTQMFSQVWKGLSFYSEGSTGFVDVRDVSKSALMLMEKGVENMRFIISSENVSYRKVFDLIAENLGKKKATIRVTPLMAGIGWRAESLLGLFTGKNPLVTKETARSAMSHWIYSNEKIKKEIGIEFISIEKSVRDSCEYFLREIMGK